MEMLSSERRLLSVHAACSSATYRVPVGLPLDMCLEPKHAIILQPITAIQHSLAKAQSAAIEPAQTGMQLHWR